jgi:hypothetical protein
LTLTFKHSNDKSKVTTDPSHKCQNQQNNSYSAAHELYDLNLNEDKPLDQIDKDKLVRDIAYLHRLAAGSNDTLEYIVTETNIGYVLPYI